MLKPFLLMPAVILLAFTPMPGLGRMSQEAAPAASAAKPNAKMTAEAQAKAKRIYAVDCEMCHGTNGSGKTDLAKDMQLALDDWTDPKSLAGKTDDQLFDVIRKGKDKMPAETEGRAKNDDVHNLILYIRSMSSQQAATTAPPAN